MNKIIKYTGSSFLALFGLMTLFMTLSIVFDLFGIREKEGNYVLFIVITNLLCGLVYIAAVLPFYNQKKSAYTLLFTATIILIAALITFFIYISMGGIHEKKTIGAMLFRIGVTALLTFFARKFSK